MAKVRETVVRRCPYTGALVLAEILIDETNIICMHNGDVREDKKEVDKWLNL